MRIELQLIGKIGPGPAIQGKKQTVLDLTGSRKSNMAPFKTELPKSQLVDNIGTKFHRQRHVFAVQLSK